MASKVIPVIIICNQQEGRNGCDQPRTGGISYVGENLHVTHNNYHSIPIFSHIALASCKEVLLEIWVHEQVNTQTVKKVCTVQNGKVCMSRIKATEKDSQV